MGIVDTTMTLIFGVGFPTFDIYSDVALAYKFIVVGHPNYGISMLVPVFFSTLAILPHWWKVDGKTDNSKLNKIWTFILVMMQLWPQWKMIQILVMGLWEKNPNWRTKKQEFQRNFGSLGKY